MLLVVGHQHHRQAQPSLGDLKLPQQGSDQWGVQVGERPVQQQHVSLPDHGPGDRHPPRHLPARQFVRIAIVQAGQPEPKHCDGHLLVRQLRPSAARPHPETDVLCHGEVGEQALGLEDHRRRPVLRAPGVGHLVEEHFTGIRGFKARYQPEQGRLAAARRSDHRDQAARRQDGVHPRQRHLFAVVAPDTTQGDLDAHGDVSDRGPSSRTTSKAPATRTARVTFIAAADELACLDIDQHAHRQQRHLGIGQQDHRRDRGERPGEDHQAGVQPL